MRMQLHAPCTFDNCTRSGSPHNVLHSSSMIIMCGLSSEQSESLLLEGTLTSYLPYETTPTIKVTGSLHADTRAVYLIKRYFMFFFVAKNKAV